MDEQRLSRMSDSGEKYGVERVVGVYESDLMMLMPPVLSRIAYFTSKMEPMPLVRAAAITSSGSIRIPCMAS